MMMPCTCGLELTPYTIDNGDGPSWFITCNHGVLDGPTVGAFDKETEALVIATWNEVI